VGADIGEQGRTDRPLRVTFFLEQHLGHRTYAENLREAARRRDDIDAGWVPIAYRAPDPKWLPSAARRVLGSLAGRREVRSGLKRGHSDVDVYNTQVPAALAGRAIRRPYIVVTDITPTQYDAMAEGYGHRADRPGPVARWKHRTNTRVLREAACCVGWSSWTAASFTNDYGVAVERTAVIPPGVDVERWKPAGDARDVGRTHLLFVGGDLRRKGGDLLLDVFRELPETVHLTLVTKTTVPGSERVRVVDDLGPNDPRLVALYQSADVFVLPTTAEAFGIAAVEASATGLPVVATRVGGLVDIVDDGVTGCLLEPGDRGGLAAALQRLTADAGLRRQMGTAARARACDAFDAAKNAGRLLDLARSVAR
jgi:glycosyltransferase involved in cell wall biosynthesis